jgi:hypothetical protein
VNHGYDRSAWKTPLLRWPYFAQAQQGIAPSVPELRCGLFFAGTTGGGIYAARTALLEALCANGVAVSQPTKGLNTIDRTPEIAASADAILGFGRPEVPGWVDTRVFQYPGAGGILVHDDVGDYLRPWVHYVPYISGNVGSILDSLAKLRLMSDSDRMGLRLRAFEHVQRHHSSIARVRQVLDTLGVA